LSSYAFFSAKDLDPASVYWPELVDEDSPLSDAICLPLDECAQLCSELRAVGEDCESFEAHEYLPRCFLNVGGSRPSITGRAGTKPSTAEVVEASCAHEWQSNGLMAFENYTFYWWRGNIKAEARPVDPLTSTASLLRFPNLRTLNAGAFKVCFCDGRGGCASPADFAMEVGEIQASGLHCMAGLSCRAQPLGGFSCGVQRRRQAPSWPMVDVPWGTAPTITVSPKLPTAWDKLSLR
jgi:hypothetical protein